MLETLDLGDPQFDHVIFDIDGTLSDCEHRRHLVDGTVRCVSCFVLPTVDALMGVMKNCRCPNSDTTTAPDWDAFFEGCDQDPMNVPVVLLARCLKMVGYRVILCTGRPERVRDKTELWLRDRDVPCDYLLMRKDGDHRPDDQVKREMLQHIETKVSRARILCVFDDRESVVKMWREEGLTVCQVAEGKF